MHLLYLGYKCDCLGWQVHFRLGYKVEAFMLIFSFVEAMTQLATLTPSSHVPKSVCLIGDDNLVDYLPR